MLSARSARPTEFEQLVHFNEIRALVADALEETQVGAAGEVRIERGRFDHRADAMESGETRSTDVVAKEADGARRGFDETQQQTDGRCLAGAVGTKQTEDSAPGNAQRQVPDSDDGAELLAQACGLDEELT